MNTKQTLMLFFALLTLAVPLQAAAQEVVETEEEVVVEKEIVDEDVPDPELQELDPEDPLYWAKMRDVYTYQKKGVRKDGRFAISLYTGIIPNNIFEQYVPFGLRLDYYVLENVGIEVASSYDLKITTSLAQTLKDSNHVQKNGVLLGDSQLSHTNVGVLWSPLYGKTSWYEATINYFDVYLYGGIGLVIVQTQADFGTKAKTEYKVEGAIGAGVNFFLGEHAYLRLDFRQFVFLKAKLRNQSAAQVAKPSEISLGFGWMF